MKLFGTVQSFDSAKGFGSIKPESRRRRAALREQRHQVGAYQFPEGRPAPVL